MCVYSERKCLIKIDTDLMKRAGFSCATHYYGDFLTILNLNDLLPVIYS